jgi:diguanylate cyclase (GGDEF)-like protein/PAS domain S-box-containing protein
MATPAYGTMVQDPTRAAPPNVQALQQQHDRLRRLVDGLGAIVSADLATEALLTRVLGFVMEATGAAGAAILRFDGAAIEYVATAGALAPFAGLRLERDAGASMPCPDEDGPQRENGLCASHEVCARVGARSLLEVPLRHAGATIGMLGAVSPDADAFDELDRTALRLAAGVTGHAIGSQLVRDENLQLSEQNMRALSQASTVLEASPTPTLVHGLDGIVRMLNPAAEALLGWTADEVIGRPMPAEYAPPDEFDEITARIVREGAGATEIVRRRRKDGSVIHVRISGATVRDRSGEVIGVVRTIEDVGGFRAHAESLRAAAERVRNIIERSHDAFISMDETGLVTEWNRAAEQLFGWSRQEALLRPLETLIIPEEAREAHRIGLKRFLSSGQSDLIGRRIELMGVRKDGTQVPVELSINATDVDGRPVFDSFLADLSERRAEINQLRRQALLDMLTRLPGREYFLGQLRTSLERGRETPGHLAVLLVNLDGFRAINDLYGHATGDALLQGVAPRLQTAVRDRGTVARLGGDEFAILVPELGNAREDAAEVAREVLAAFDEPVRLRISPLPVQMSIGIALHEYPFEDVESLMHRAHEAMHAAKQAGGNRFEMISRVSPDLSDA